ncbi:hypothetical protein M427DRAFT_50272 [Gonapodya prolifera JEL478]|uniref:Uncharacterized protein n=1 Tax=Gonapodya prolifera (strain JEL478) TaxID=1344416 RepID=A0A138ZWF9_GONPJ|nr:hypothetical protein M427DRAFT_50272 [Gonapodya prolifera JEL478]|eukprot:KXS08842.1 hypothetical protein M427DRAFT_50272 [Gonapodya prolifera JEL478]
MATQYTKALQQHMMDVIMFSKELGTDLKTFDISSLSEQQTKIVLALLNPNHPGLGEVPEPDFDLPFDDEFYQASIEYVHQKAVFEATPNIRYCIRYIGFDCGQEKHKFQLPITGKRIKFPSAISNMSFLYFSFRTYELSTLCELYFTLTTSFDDKTQWVDGFLKNAPGGPRVGLIEWTADVCTQVKRLCYYENPKFAPSMHKIEKINVIYHSDGVGGYCEGGGATTMKVVAGVGAESDGSELKLDMSSDTLGGPGSGQVGLQKGLLCGGGGTNYLWGYEVAAFYFRWIELTMKGDFMLSLNQLTIQSGWSDNHFQTLTGYTNDQLWSKYVLAQGWIMFLPLDGGNKTMSDSVVIILLGAICLAIVIYLLTSGGAGIFNNESNGGGNTNNGGTSSRCEIPSDPNAFQALAISSGDWDNTKTYQQNVDTQRAVCLNKFNAGQGCVNPFAPNTQLPWCFKPSVGSGPTCQIPSIDALRKLKVSLQSTWDQSLDFEANAAKQKTGIHVLFYMFEDLHSDSCYDWHTTPLHAHTPNQLNVWRLLEHQHLPRKEYFGFSHRGLFFVVKMERESRPMSRSSRSARSSSRSGRRKCTKWIEAFGLCGEDEKFLAKVMVENVHNAEKYQNKKFYFFEDPPFQQNMSNRPSLSKRWVIRHLAPKLDEIFRDRWAVTYDCRKRRFWNDEETDTSQESKVLVVVDDALYSGAQLLSQLIDCSRKTELMLIVPFCTDSGIGLIRELQAKGIPVKYFMPDPPNMQTMFDVLINMGKSHEDVSRYLGLMEKTFGGYESKYVLTFFQHKMPDAKSVPAVFQKRNVPCLGGDLAKETFFCFPHIVPPYKDADYDGLKEYDERTVTARDSKIKVPTVQRDQTVPLTNLNVPQSSTSSTPQSNRYVPQSSTSSTPQSNRTWSPPQVQCGMLYTLLNAQLSN